MPQVLEIDNAYAELMSVLEIHIHRGGAETLRKSKIIKLLMTFSASQRLCGEKRPPDIFSSFPGLKHSITSSRISKNY
jgi:hypothetical protein